MMTAVVVLILMWSVSVAEAQRGQHMRGPQNQAQQQAEMEECYQYGPGMMGSDMGMTGFMYLPDLTEEQQSEIRSIIRELRRQHIADIMDMRDDNDDYGYQCPATYAG